MPRTRSLAWSELKLGLLALTAIILATFLIFLVGGQTGFFWQRYHLKTTFANVMGLKQGAVVRLAGVEVGQVTTVDFVGAQVEVHMELREGVQNKITTESRAVLGSLSLLGESVVDINPSSQGQPIPDWGYIKSTKTPGQLADVAEGATKGIEEITKLLQDVRSGKGTLGKLVTDEAVYREFQQLLSSAEQVVATINSGKGTLGQLTNDPAAYRSLKASLQNLESVTTRINAGEGSLGQLLKDDALAQSLSRTSGNVEQITSRITKGEGTAGKLITDAALYNRLSSISERLDKLVTGLNQGEGTAGQLLRDKQLYENMNGAVTELRTLITDIRKDPRKFLNVRVSIF